jgi:hypothetical protein
MNVHLWVEPCCVLLTATILRFAAGELNLSRWLMIVAPCMFLKELLNYWTAIRREKIAGDITEEAAERGDVLSGGNDAAVAPRATRVAGKRITRKGGSERID